MKPIKNTGLILFAIGILLGLALTASAVIPDVEATFYGFKTITNKQLTSLRCPVIVTRAGTNTVQASVTNTTKKTAKPILRVNLSNPGPLTPEQTIFELQPGETRKFEWTVSQDNVDLENFIFVNVLVYSFYDIPARQSTCGMLYLDIPLIPGWLLLFLLLFIFVLLTLFGYLSWEKNNQAQANRSLDVSRALKFLAGLVLAGMCFGFLGWWLPGGALLIVAILTVGTMMYLWIQQAER